MKTLFSFSQYAVESYLFLLLFYGYYRVAIKSAVGFQWERWYLQVAPLLACLLPFLSAIPLQNGFDRLALSLPVTELLNWRENGFPEFTISVGVILRLIFFMGFAILAFRLVDKLSAIGSFFLGRGQKLPWFIGWRHSGVVHFSRLFSSWDSWDDEQKDNWASQHSPVHPFYAWEALLLHFLLLLNWWNPAMQGFAKDWKTLYSQEFFPEKKLRSNLRMAGATGLFFFLAVPYALISPAYSPSAYLGSTISNWAEKVIFERKIAEKGYALSWGEISIPLEKLAAPNGFGGEIELELQDFQQALQREIKVLKDGKPMKTGILSFLFYSKTTGNHAYINGIDPKNVALRDRRQGQVYNDSLRFGDELMLFGEGGEIYLTSVKFHIRDPYADYEPVVKVPEINNLEANFSFQIVGRAGRRALVKIDTTSPDSRHILAMYDDPAKYEIVEISGFRTNRHYLSESEALSAKVAVHETQLVHALPDVYYLPEYQAYQNQEIRLDWGTMTASPSSQNYPEQAFARADEQPLTLSVGERNLEIASFELIITGKHIPSLGFQTDRLNHPAISQVLRNLAPESSIYFDHLVVRDADNKLKLFPVSFVFNIGKSDASHAEPYFK